MSVPLSIFNIIFPTEEREFSLRAHPQLPNSLPHFIFWITSWLDKHQFVVLLFADHWVGGFRPSCLVLDLQAVVGEFSEVFKLKFKRRIEINEKNLNGGGKEVCEATASIERSSNWIL